MAQYNKSSKWLIQHHGDSILRLAGVRDVESWRALQAELVQPTKLPDGLLEVKLRGRPEQDLFLLEIATYADRRGHEQVLADAAFVYLDRGRLPAVLSIVLKPKGNVRVDEQLKLASPYGWTQWKMSWRSVNLWELSAEQLLTVGDPGLAPWIPLTDFSDPPQSLLARCRQEIGQAPVDEQPNLLAVTQVLATLRWNDPALLNLLGGRDAMIESPLLQQFEAETTAKDIIEFLQARFGELPSDLSGRVKAIQNLDRLQELVRLAAQCPDLVAFEAALS